MNASVYLAGQIQHAADHGKGWRQRLKDGDITHEASIEWLDPMDKYNTHEMEYKEWTSEDIVREDLEIIANCDAVLVHWPKHRSERPLYQTGIKDRKCAKCGEGYSQLAKHYSMSNCQYPEPSQKEKDAVKGIVMSDGHIGNRNGTPRLDIQLTNPAALDSFAETIPSFHPKTWKTDKKTNAGNEIYRLTTISHPWLNEVAEWYSSGEKEYPAQIELTPEIAKWWYIGDGSMIWNNKAQHGYIQISCVNEKENIEKLCDILNDFSPTIYSSGECSLDTENTKKFLDYIGEPVQGMEYKWEMDSVVNYQKKKPFAGVSTAGTPMEVFFSNYFPQMTRMIKRISDEAAANSTSTSREILEHHAEQVGFEDWEFELILALSEDVPVVVQTRVPSEEISPWLTSHADAMVESFPEAAHWIENNVNGGDAPEPEMLEPEYELKA